MERTIGCTRPSRGAFDKGKFSGKGVRSPRLLTLGGAKISRGYGRNDGPSICAEFFVRGVQTPLSLKTTSAAARRANDDSAGDIPSVLFHSRSPVWLPFQAFFSFFRDRRPGIAHFSARAITCARSRCLSCKAHAVHGKVCQDLLFRKERAIGCSRRWFMATQDVATIFFNAAAMRRLLLSLRLPLLLGWLPIDRSPRIENILLNGSDEPAGWNAGHKIHRPWTLEGDGVERKGEGPWGSRLAVLRCLVCSNVWNDSVVKEKQFLPGK